MILWRIECPISRSGPHTESYTFGQIQSSQELWNRYYEALQRALNQHGPSTEPDGRSMRAYEVCGVDSYETLLYWFGVENVVTLLELGYVIHVYEVPDEKVTRFASGQCLFDVNFDDRSRASKHNTPPVRRYSTLPVPA